MAQGSAGVAAICNAKQTQPTFPTAPPTIVNFTPPTIGDWSSVIQAILQLQWALIPIVNPPPLNNTLPEITVGLGSGVGGGGSGGGGGGAGGNSPGNKGKGNKNPQNNQPQDPNKDKQNSSNPVKWEQTNKVTELVKIVNPDDHSQFVIVRRTVTQTFKNPVTKETLTINNPDR
jgi:hypothetical protein